ncbi:ABC transporter permease [Allochromatium tepidum]|uniref:ABC transporter permease n=1 Tax=Allochromatium tepidum TaxID=553982 RepID=UPI001F3735E7|nr:ABC transporter permease [Allochromatium tepidum]
MSTLDRKLRRELWSLRGQVLAIAVVIAGGVSTLLMSLATLDSLTLTRDAFYRDYAPGGARTGHAARRRLGRADPSGRGASASRQCRTLTERARDPATLRVLGFSLGEITAILLGELALLTAIAIPVGFGIGWGLIALIVRGVESELYRIPLILEPSVFAFAASVILVAALLSGLLVARRLRELDLVAVLKTQE